MARKGTIRGIECHLRTERARRAVRSVLKRIRTIDPVAYERIQIVLWRIGPLEDPDGMDAAGLTRNLHGIDQTDPRRLAMQRQLLEHDCERDCISYHDQPCEILFEESLPGMLLPVVVAHELGHVATTYEDMDARCIPDAEWASEMTADFYVYKWGYGKAREQYRDDGSWRHHGHAPGETLVMENPDGKWYGYRVGRDFVATRFELTAERIEELRRERPAMFAAAGIEQPKSD